MEIDESTPVKVYDLYAIVVHSGSSAHCGHYYTIAKDGINKDGWKIFNDATVTSIPDAMITEIFR